MGVPFRFPGYVVIAVIVFDPTPSQGTEEANRWISHPPSVPSRLRHLPVRNHQHAIRPQHGGYTHNPWGPGSELSAHKRFTVATNVQVYFCDSQSPCQRGTNENTNGLLRQYFPKETDLSPYTQADLDDVALRLNSRPRKKLGYATPVDRLVAVVASTG